MKKTQYPDWFLQAWPDGRLDAMRLTGDTFADSVIRALVTSHSIDGANQVLAALAANDGPLPANASGDLKEYLEFSQKLPHWADGDLIKTAQEFFAVNGAGFGISLMFRSLPMLFAAGTGGAQTLQMAGGFTHNYRRRTSETLKFVIAAMEPGGLDPGGDGIRVIQKIRLMHAGVRYWAERSGRWNPQWGVAIHQEELVGTLIALSVSAIEGLRKLDVSVTAEEEVAVFHTWQVIGHMLGILPSSMPSSVDEARWLWLKIQERNFCPSAAARQLMDAHIAFMEELANETMFAKMVPAMLRFMMGRRIAVDILGVPKPGLWIVLVLFVRKLLGLGAALVEHSDPVIRHWIGAESIRYMKNAQRYWQGADTSQPFRIPSKLPDTA